MASWEQVREIALGMPGSSERESRGRAQWWVGDRLFVWERPLRAGEIMELGDAAPGGPILGARVEHLGAKEALLADAPAIFFSTSHFKGAAAVLIRLDEIGPEDLREAIVEAWLARAPARIAKAYIEANLPPRED
jgi:hypothetical protein